MSDLALHAIANLLLAQLEGDVKRAEHKERAKELLRQDWLRMYPPVEDADGEA